MTSGTSKGPAALQDATILLQLLSMDDASPTSLSGSPHQQVSSRRQINETCLDLLLAEMVTHTFTLYSSSQDSSGTGGASGSNPSPPSSSSAYPLPSSVLTAHHAPDVHPRLEGLGYRVGTALAERYTKGRPYMTENLDVIKFICKDFWIAVFRRQVDNLRTNHRGVYVLQDNTFRWLSRASTGLGGADAARRAQPFLWFPCGIIRGALANLGVTATVTAETTGLPQCTFHIKIHKS